MVQNALMDQPQGNDATPPEAASPNAPTPTPPPASDMGASVVGRTAIVIAAVVLIASATLVAIALVQLWPAGTGLSPAAHSYVVLGVHTTLTGDRDLMLIAALSGALGAMLHSLRSLSVYVGERALLWSWMLFYACLPVIGAILSLLFYFVLRGGLISGQATSRDVNPFGTAAVAGLVGLFSTQAAEMLKNVFTAIFTKAPQGSDSVSHGGANP